MIKTRPLLFWFQSFFSAGEDGIALHISGTFMMNCVEFYIDTEHNYIAVNELSSTFNMYSTEESVKLVVPPLI